MDKTVTKNVTKTVTVWIVLARCDGKRIDVGDVWHRVPYDRLAVENRAGTAHRAVFSGRRFARSYSTDYGEGWVVSLRCREVPKDVWRRVRLGRASLHDLADVFAVGADAFTGA